MNASLHDNANSRTRSGWVGASRSIRWRTSRASTAANTASRTPAAMRPSWLLLIASVAAASSLLLLSSATGAVAAPPPSAKVPISYSQDPAAEPPFDLAAAIGLRPENPLTAGVAPDGFLSRFLQLREDIEESGAPVPAAGDGGAARYDTAAAVGNSIARGMGPATTTGTATPGAVSGLWRGGAYTASSGAPWSNFLGSRTTGLLPAAAPVPQQPSSDAGTKLK